MLDSLKTLKNISYAKITPSFIFDRQYGFKEKEHLTLVLRMLTVYICIDLKLVRKCQLNGDKR